MTPLSPELSAEIAAAITAGVERAVARVAGDLARRVATANTKRSGSLTWAAKISGTDPKTLRALIDAKKLPARRLPGRGRYGEVFDINLRDLERATGKDLRQ